MVFENYQGYKKVQLKDDFVSWHAYVKDNPDNEVEFTTLINENPEETIGQFNTLKDRDWILFQTEDDFEGFQTLKIRYTPLKKGEVVYACGWCTMADDTCKLVRSKLRMFKSMGR